MTRKKGIALKRNKTKRICIYMNRKKENIYFKDLAHAIMEVSKSKIYRVASRLEFQRRIHIVSESQGSQLAEFPLPERLIFCFCFFPLKLSTDKIRPDCVMVGNLLYSESTDLNVNLIKKHLHRNVLNTVWPINGYHGIVKLTHKINHFKLYELKEQLNSQEDKE